MGLERLLAKDSASDCGSSSSSFLIASCKAPERRSLAVFLILSAVAIFNGELPRLGIAILIYQPINHLFMGAAEQGINTNLSNPAACLVLLLGLGLKLKFRSMAI